MLGQIEKITSKKKNPKPTKQNAGKKQAKKPQPDVADTVQCEKCGVNSLYFFSVGDH